MGRRHSMGLGQASPANWAGCPLPRPRGSRTEPPAGRRPAHTSWGNAALFWPALGWRAPTHMPHPACSWVTQAWASLDRRSRRF